jgi:hypothetical protein
MVAPSQAQPGSAHGPEPSTWQCMLIMCPHRHAPRICCDVWRLAMVEKDRKWNAKGAPQD